MTPYISLELAATLAAFHIQIKGITVIPVMNLDERILITASENDFAPCLLLRF